MVIMILYEKAFMIRSYTAQAMKKIGLNWIR
jgi:hypothetical protein